MTGQHLTYGSPSDVQIAAYSFFKHWGQAIERTSEAVKKQDQGYDQLVGWR